LETVYHNVSADPENEEYPCMSDQEPLNPGEPLLDPKSSEALMRMLIGALLFRLGGEETFTEAELDEIRVSVGGVQVFYVPESPGHPEGRYILRIRDPQKAAELALRGVEI
jgi:hypothetical protein